MFSCSPVTITLVLFCSYSYRSSLLFQTFKLCSRFSVLLAATTTSSKNALLDIVILCSFQFLTTLLTFRYDFVQVLLRNLNSALR